MQNKRFWFSVFGVWAFMMVTDFLLHGIWLAPIYQQTSQFWRSSDDMQKMMPWMWVGQLMFSWAFVWIYTKGLEKGSQWGQAFRYALAILFVAKIPEQLTMWASVPYPMDLVVRWLFIAVVQATGAAFIAAWIWKPVRARS